MILHLSLFIPSDNNIPQKNAATRITSKPLELKAAQDYAKELSVHVNYLNSAVKEATGKPTTAHISDRIISEAKVLLQHTNWSVADIAYALGFEYPTYFNNFFKKKTGQIPKTIRFSNL